nr:YbhN family protein [Nocardioides soli]
MRHGVGVAEPVPVSGVLWSWLRGAGLVVVTVAAVEYGLVPFLARARSDLVVLEAAVWPLLLVAGALEVMSLAAYTRLTQTLLEPDQRLTFGTQWRIDLAGYGLGHALPGGGATAGGLRVTLMTDRGVSPASALALTVVQLALSALGLAAVWLLGVLMAVPRTGVTMTLVLLLAVTAAALVVLETAPHRSAASPRFSRAGRRVLRVLVPLRWRAQVRAAVATGAVTLRDGRVTRSGVAWAILNWLLDSICLWVCLRAFGAVVPIEVVIAAYGLANTVALLPVTPGGIGIVEGLMIPAMATTGASAGAAVAGVLTWRLFQFWLPIPVGALCWVSLVRLAGRGPDRARTFGPGAGSVPGVDPNQELSRGARDEQEGAGPGGQLRRDDRGPEGEARAGR